MIKNMSLGKKISLGFDGMTLEDLMSVARKNARVRITAKAKKRIWKARKLIEKWVREGRTIYGITTGFGALSDVIISGEDTRTLQAMEPEEESESQDQS